jgi:hypothetical protein
MMATKREKSSDFRALLDMGLPAEEYREMWQKSHELHEREVKALEQIADLLDHWPHGLYTDKR